MNSINNYALNPAGYQAFLLFFRNPQNGTCFGACVPYTVYADGSFLGN